MWSSTRTATIIASRGGGQGRGLTHSRFRPKKLDILETDLVEWTFTDHLNTVRDIAWFDPQMGATTVVNHFCCDTLVHLLYGVRNHLVYDAFGRVTSETSPAVDLQSDFSMGIPRPEKAYDRSPLGLAFLFTARQVVAQTDLRSNNPARPCAIRTSGQRGFGLRYAARYGM